MFFFETSFLVSCCICFVLINAKAIHIKKGPCNSDIVPRECWGARQPKLVEPMPNPVPFVIIHHSYQPPACNNSAQCIKAMQSMQNFHMDDRGWNDIGYSFAVGGDAKAYFGRGWQAVGAHAPSYNNRSIGICIIGDWRYELPSNAMLKAVKNLISYGIQKGHIDPNYTLLGHRQVRDTECPGQALYDEIRTWSHYSPDPDMPWNPKNERIDSPIDEKEVEQENIIPTQ